MKTNGLFALGLTMALAGGACGGDDGGKTKPTDAGYTTLPDGNMVPNGDGGGNNTNTDGGGNTNTDGGDNNQNDGGQQTGNGSGVITSAGGSVTSSDGNLTVTFGRYALTRTTNVTVSVLTPAPDGAQGTVYSIEPHQEAISTLNGASVKVTIKYTAAELGTNSPQTLKLGQYLNGHWVEVGLLNNASETAPKANPNAMTYTGYVSQLAPVAIIGGICVDCPTPSCTTGMPCTIGENATPGTCVTLADGCNVCRQACDTDKDGFCQVGGNPGGDCNDSDPNIRPGGTVPAGFSGDWPELCNGIDDNCNNVTDEGCTACKSDAECTVYGQSCLRGFCSLCNVGCDDTTASKNCGTATNPGHCVSWGMGCSSCVQTCDLDGDGQCPSAMPSQGDCDETNRYRNSQAPEICGNNIDDDCNGFVDDNCNTCSKDSDCPADGLECLAGVCVGCPASTACDPAVAGGACSVNNVQGTCMAVGKNCHACITGCDTDHDGACANNGDCDDSNPNIRANGSYPEICGNGIDDNCNNHKDEGCTACASDADCKVAQESCQKGACQTCDSNCNTNDNCRWPLYSADPSKAIPGQCLPTGNACLKCVPPGDMDGDGFVTNTVAQMYAAGTPSVTLPAGDCDDTMAGVRPSLQDNPWPELCGNKIDDNCNGLTDELCTTCEASAMCGAPEVCDNTR